jgi:malonyl CoA-acyl carrier protein transacylase
MSEGTAYAQPAVYCASTAGYEQLGRPAAGFFAGHSLGEIGACRRRAIDDADGLRIVVARGRVMDDVARAVSRAACSPSARTGMPQRPCPASTA